MSCIKEENHSKDLLGILVVWNNMPSRVTYTLISKKDGTERHLDPDDGEDEQVIFVAGQLSRIINRKLELAAYQYLQHVLNTGDSITTALLLRLGHLLLTLRWRVSWWNLLGSGASSSATVAEQHDKDRFATRVQTLCRILYFYYCSMQRRLPASSDRSGLRGKFSRYADTGTEVWEVYPSVESVEGFEAWMRDGEVKIREANVVEQLKKVGLT